MSYVFDITENMQASVRFGTGCHPDGKSLGIYIHGPEELHTEGERPRALDLNAYDAVDWERAVAFAKWILSFGEGEE